MNKIDYKCSMCGTDMVKTIGTINSYGSVAIGLKCPECQNSWQFNDRVHYCRTCNGEMDKSIEKGYTVLRCIKCRDSWISPKPSVGWGRKKSR